VLDILYPDSQTHTEEDTPVEAEEVWEEELSEAEAEAEEIEIGIMQQVSQGGIDIIWGIQPGARYRLQPLRRNP
jgi:hypothetical protein